jgi:hypothetical protein
LPQRHQISSVWGRIDPLGICRLALLLLSSAALDSPALALPQLAGSDGSSAAASLDAADDLTRPWLPYKTKRGIPVWRRPVLGSRYFEYKAVIPVPLPPQVVLEQVWRHLATVIPGAVQRRQLLSQTATEIVFYDQIHSPVVTDRDYTLALHRLLDADGKALRLRFESANQLGPPPTPQYVRVPAIRGSWSVEPDGDSGSLLTHRNFSEPGGSIPSFLVHGAQCDQVIDSMVSLQAHLQKLPPPSPIPPTVAATASSPKL